MPTAKTAKKPPAQRFRVLLETAEGSEAAGITIPFDAQKVFGTRARVPFRGSIFPNGDGTHYMVVRKQLREAAGVRGGEIISIAMERDDEPRTVTPPTELARALKADKRARVAWDKLSYTRQREYAESIAGAKRPETRLRRIENALAELSERGKR